MLSSARRGDASKSRCVHFLGGAFTPALAEDVDALARAGGNQVAHVFHQSEDGHTDLGEHVDGFSGVFERYVGRGGHYYGARERGGLDAGQSHVAGAGREVD